MLDVDLAVSEDCLHLAVSTPDLKPAEPLPVMVFVYGGGFKAGTQLKMGYERLGDVNDVVLVALNYRVGPLGKKKIFLKKRGKSFIFLQFFELYFANVVFPLFLCGPFFLSRSEK